MRSRIEISVTWRVAAGKRQTDAVKLTFTNSTPDKNQNSVRMIVIQGKWRLVTRKLLILLYEDVYSTVTTKSG